MTPILVIITSLITAVFGPVVVEWTKSKFSSKITKDTLGDSIDVNEKINTQLELIMDELKCDRLSISQFHNGGNFFPTGKSIKKFSIFYECVNENAPSIKDTFQNIPVSLFSKTFSLLYKNNEIVIPTINNNNNNAEYYLFQVKGKEYNTKSFYMLTIRDIDDHFIGFITISYYKEEHVLTLDEWILIRQKLGVIGTILTNYLRK